MLRATCMSSIQTHTAFLCAVFYKRHFCVPPDTSGVYIGLLSVTSLLSGFIATFMNVVIYSLLLQPTFEKPISAPIHHCHNIQTQISEMCLWESFDSSHKQWVGNYVLLIHCVSPVWYFLAHMSCEHDLVVKLSVRNNIVLATGYFGARAVIRSLLEFLWLRSAVQFNTQTCKIGCNSVKYKIVFS